MCENEVELYATVAKHQSEASLVFSKSVWSTRPRFKFFFVSPILHTKHEYTISRWSIFRAISILMPILLYGTKLSFFSLIYVWPSEHCITCVKVCIILWLTYSQRVVRVHSQNSTFENKYSTSMHATFECNRCKAFPSGGWGQFIRLNFKPSCGFQSFLVLDTAAYVPPFFFFFHHTQILFLFHSFPILSLPSLLFFCNTNIIIIPYFNNIQKVYTWAFKRNIRTN